MSNIVEVIICKNRYRAVLFTCVCEGGCANATFYNVIRIWVYVCKSLVSEVFLFCNGDADFLHSLLLVSLARVSNIASISTIGFPLLIVLCVSPSYLEVLFYCCKSNNILWAPKKALVSLWNMDLLVKIGLSEKCKIHFLF